MQLHCLPQQKLKSTFFGRFFSKVLFIINIEYSIYSLGTYFSIFSPHYSILFTNALPESKSFSEIRLDTAAETKAHIYIVILFWEPKANESF